MKKYKNLRSILNLDGKNYAVDLLTWGYRTLTGDALTQFRLDMDDIKKINEQQVINGELSFTEMFETLTTSESNEINFFVGVILEKSENYVDDPRWISWSLQMSQDPKVIVFNPEIEIL